MAHRRQALLLTTLALAIKFRNPRDVSGFQKFFLKKGKHDVNGKFVFELVRMIVNITTSIFI